MAKGFASNTLSDSVREHSHDAYVRAARQQRLSRFSINVGEVHRALALRNRVPLVCMALKSAKFLSANGLRLVSESGPPSGLSTTVTYTYQFIDASDRPQKEEAWSRLRGALREIFVEAGSGEAYLRNERDQFFRSRETE